MVRRPCSTDGAEDMTRRCSPLRARCNESAFRRGSRWRPPRAMPSELRLVGRRSDAWQTPHERRRRAERAVKTVRPGEGSGSLVVPGQGRSGHRTLSLTTWPLPVLPHSDTRRDGGDSDGVSTGAAASPARASKMEDGRRLPSEPKRRTSGRACGAVGPRQREWPARRPSLPRSQVRPARRSSQARRYGRGRS